MSEKAFCDLCGKEIADIRYGVRLDEKIRVQIGGANWDDVCQECYKSIHEYVESMKKK